MMSGQRDTANEKTQKKNRKKQIEKGKLNRQIEGGVVGNCNIVTVEWDEGKKSQG